MGSPAYPLTCPSSVGFFFYFFFFFPFVPSTLQRDVAPQQTSRGKGGCVSPHPPIPLDPASQPGFFPQVTIHKGRTTRGRLAFPKQTSSTCMPCRGVHLFCWMEGPSFCQMKGRSDAPVCRSSRRAGERKGRRAPPSTGAAAAARPYTTYAPQDPGLECQRARLVCFVLHDKPEGPGLPARGSCS